MRKYDWLVTSSSGNYGKMLALAGHFDSGCGTMPDWD
jgi:hypothetical protein